MELGSLCFPKTFHNVVKGFGETQRTKLGGVDTTDINQEVMKLCKISAVCY